MERSGIHAIRMPQSIQRVKESQKYHGIASENKRQPITSAPTLRYYKINGEYRLVWVFRANGQIHVIVNTSRLTDMTRAKADFTQKYNNRVFGDYKEKLKVRKLPRNLKKAFGNLADDNMEWGFAVDFEDGIELPERVVIQPGGGRSVMLGNMQDLELSGHTHPAITSTKNFPSAADFARTTIENPNLLSYEADNGQIKFLLINSYLDRPDPKDVNGYLDRKARLDEIIIKLQEKHKYVYDNAFLDDLRMQVNEQGYNFESIDPARAKFITKNDAHHEKFERVLRRGDANARFNPEIIRDIVKKYDGGTKHDLEATTMLSEIEVYVNALDATENPEALEIFNIVRVEGMTNKNDAPQIVKKVLDIADKSQYARQDIRETRAGLFDAGLTSEAIRLNHKNLKHAKEGVDMDSGQFDDFADHVDGSLTLDENIERIDSMIRHGWMEAQKGGKKASTQQTAPPIKPKLVEIEPDEVTDGVRFNEPGWQVDTIQMHAKDTGLDVRLKASRDEELTEQAKQLPRPPKNKVKHGKNASVNANQKKEIKRILGWKRIQKDKKLKKALEEVLDNGEKT